MWVRGLKPNSTSYDEGDGMSHPMWVRGLKLIVQDKLIVLAMSHPMWVRGLKLPRMSLRLMTLFVAPHVGAWIETVSV